MQPKPAASRSPPSGRASQAIAAKGLLLLSAMGEQETALRLKHLVQLRLRRPPKDVPMRACEAAHSAEQVSAPGVSRSARGYRRARATPVRMRLMAGAWDLDGMVRAHRLAMPTGRVTGMALSEALATPEATVLAMREEGSATPGGTVLATQEEGSAALRGPVLATQEGVPAALGGVALALLAGAAVPTASHQVAMRAGDSKGST